MHRVLIAEPDIGLRETLDLILRMAGYSTQTAREHGEALTLARAFSPGVIVATITPSDPDSFSMVSTYRSELNNNAASVVVMARSRLDESLARDAGADEILLMPFEASDLLAAVRRAAQAREADDSAPVDLVPSVPGSGGTALPA